MSQVCVDQYLDSESSIVMNDIFDTVNSGQSIESGQITFAKHWLERKSEKKTTFPPRAKVHIARPLSTEKNLSPFLHS